MSLLRKDASPSDTILYTVCVNSVAYKFLTTVLMIEEHGELSQRLWHSALQYRATAQAALRKIPLVTTPSLALLQAVLCGVSYMKTPACFSSNHFLDFLISGLGRYQFLLGVDQNRLQDLHRYWPQHQCYK